MAGKLDAVRRCKSLYCLLSLVAGGFIFARPAAALEPAKKLRRPSAMVLLKKKQQLVVANRRAGSLTLLDLAQQRVVREDVVGGAPSSISAFPAPRNGWLVVTDEQRHRLLLVKHDSAGLRVHQELKISGYPVRSVVSGDGRRVFVSSLWSRRLTVLEFAENEPKLKITRVIDLPFAPRELLLVQKDQRLIIADSFGGRLGVFDTRNHKLLGVREFPGHNIRGMGLSANGKMLIIAHQMLNELAHTVRNDVHWGLLMSNDLRWLRLASVLEGKDLYDGAHMHPLGEANSATGDPSDLAVSKDGTVVVTLGGVSEVAMGVESDFSIRRTKVGRRPTALVLDSDRKLAYVANTFDDSVSIIDYKKRLTLKTISLGPSPPLSLAERGELLFFDATLSHDGWMSCHSCHTDGHTNGLLNDNFSDASFGAPKRVLSLLGKFETGPFAWNASAKTIEAQIRNSIKSTMQSDEPPKDQHVTALSAYLKTLMGPPSLDRLRGNHDAQRVARGRKLFAKRGCVQCHTPPRYTSPDVYNVGLNDKLGNRKFNPPSLIGVGQRGPYFHDNRAKTLTEVFTKHQHQLESPLGKNALADLLAFLGSL